MANCLKSGKMGENMGRVHFKKWDIIMGFCKRLSPSKTNFNGNFMSRRYKWPFVGYTILVLSLSIIQLLWCSDVCPLPQSAREREPGPSSHHECNRGPLEAGRLIWRDSHPTCWHVLPLVCTLRQQKNSRKIETAEIYHAHRLATFHVSFSCGRCWFRTSWDQKNVWTVFLCFCVSTFYTFEARVSGQVVFAALYTQ